MSELGESLSEFSSQSGSGGKTPESNPSTRRRRGLQVRRIPKSERRLSRREFLKILGGAVLLLGTAVQGIRIYRGKGAGEKQEGSQGEAVFTPVKGEAVTEHRELFGFHPEDTKRFIQEQGLAPDAYGKLAAAGVTFMSIVEEEENEYFIHEASGGLAEYKGEYYIVSTMHVLIKALHKETRDKTQLTVNIPGLAQMYLCQPREIYTFNPRPGGEYDSPVFIKLDEALTEKVRELRAKGDLHPLQPLPIDEAFDQPITLFRFQGGKNGLHDYDIQFSRDDANVNLYNVSSDTASLCPGVSGSVGLEKENGQLTGVFLGVFTHASERIFGTETTEFTTDVHGVLGDGSTCSRSAGFTSFGKSFFSWGMTKTELP